jgi:hypothetical protein
MCHTRILSLARRLWRFFFYKFRFILQWIFNFLLPWPWRFVIVETTSIASIRSLWKFFLSQINDVPLMRVGGKHDGGYFCPANLSGIKYVFSPGYGGIKVFEDEMSDLGMKIFICDPSYDEIPGLTWSQEFDSLKITSTSSLKDNSLTLSDWIDLKVSKVTKNMLLQMDIEGFEWEVLLQVESETLDRFDILLVEFHDLDRLIYDSNFLSTANKVIKKLSPSFSNIYTRANNCGGYFLFRGKRVPKVIEVTLINNSRLKKTRTGVERQPIVDSNFSNNPSLPPLAIPFL